MERNTTIRLSAKDVVRKNLVIETEYYPLIKEQFELLVNGQSRWKDYGSKFFWASITLLIRIIAICIVITIAYHKKQMENISQNTQISVIDIMFIAICIIAAIGCHLLSKYKKTPSDKLIEKTRNYFEQET